MTTRSWEIEDAVRSLDRDAFDVDQDPWLCNHCGEVVEQEGDSYCVRCTLPKRLASEDTTGV